MAEKTVANSTSTAQPASVETESTRNRERYITPAVDIYETPDGLMVMADLPGVDKADLDVRVDNNVLTIRGVSRHVVSGDPMYREYDLVSFFRQFEIGEKIDQSKISAELKNGVLHLNLPKAETAKPRQIAVSVG